MPVIVLPSLRDGASDSFVEDVEGRGTSLSEVAHGDDRGDPGESVIKLDAKV